MVDGAGARVVSVPDGAMVVGVAGVVAAGVGAVVGGLVGGAAVRGAVPGAAVVGETRDQGPRPFDGAGMLASVHQPCYRLELGGVGPAGEEQICPQMCVTWSTRFSPYGTAAGCATGTQVSRPRPTLRPKAASPGG